MQKPFLPCRSTLNKTMKKIHTKHLTPDVLPHDTPESLAALAGGMADDFNNILTTVMGACSLIDKHDPGNGELLQCVALIRASAEHAAALSDRLMRASCRTRTVYPRTS